MTLVVAPVRASGRMMRTRQDNTQQRRADDTCSGASAGQQRNALGINCCATKKVKSSMARSLPVEDLLPQNVGSIINYLQ